MQSLLKADTGQDADALTAELRRLYLECTGEAIPDAKENDAILAEAERIKSGEAKLEDSSPAKQRRLSKALSAHLEIPDSANTFKVRGLSARTLPLFAHYHPSLTPSRVLARPQIGDVVRAEPPDGEGMKFEGVAVDVTETGIVIDFGDGEEPVECEISKVQRVNNGTILERDDVVQAKPPGTPVYCLGKILAINQDGTYDIAYDGTDDVDERVEIQYIRKVGCGWMGGWGGWGRCS